MPEQCGSGDATRFAFGRNWARFSGHVDESRVRAAEESLLSMLEMENLSGLAFLDIGSGSGLFSAAAARLGARVHSFDVDPGSVACTERMRDRFGEGAGEWIVEKGSALDAEHMDALGVFDVVYSWGVLHHTGDMWRALNLACGRVRPGGLLLIALYNHQGRLTGFWTRIKRLYNRNVLCRALLLAVFTPYFVGLRWLVRSARGERAVARGMTLWYDLKDWLGGYPFEAARPGEVLAFLRPRGFELARLDTCGGRHGCNEYVFVNAGRR